MVLRKAITATVAATLALVGTASASAAGDSIAARQVANVNEAEQLGGMGMGWLIAVLVAAGVALVIIEDDDDEPASP
jgi:uncharacterized protein YmfQ (DUF2313 family)